MGCVRVGFRDHQTGRKRDGTKFVPGSLRPGTGRDDSEFDRDGTGRDDSKLTGTGRDDSETGRDGTGTGRVPNDIL